MYGKVDGVGETMFIGKVKGEVGINKKSWGHREVKMIKSEF